MRVALVHDFLYQYGGAERVLEHLYLLFSDVTIVTLAYDYGAFPKKWRSFNVVTLSHKLPFSKNFPQLYGYWYAHLISQTDFSGYDLVISSDMVFAKLVTLPSSVFHIIYQYSPSDMLYHFHPNQSRTTVLKLLSASQKKYLRYEEYMSVRRADIYLTLSRHVANRAYKIYGIRPEVVYPPVEMHSGKNESVCDHTNYFLIVARLVKGKMIDYVIKSFGQLNFSLIIVGEGDYKGTLQSIAPPHVRFVGAVDDEEKFELYKNALGTIIPNEEDFGLTAVESLSCGTPVLAYGRGGVTEVVEHNTTGYLYDDMSVESFLFALRRFVDIPFDRSLCIEYSRRYSYQVFDTKLRTLIDELCR